MLDWKMIMDEHRWHAELASILRLRVSPSITSARDAILYDAEVCNMNLLTLDEVRGVPTVEAARAAAEGLAFGILANAQSLVAAAIRARGGGE